MGKEGWLRPLRKYREATIAGADGVVVQKKLFWSLNEPPRPLSTERGYFLMARPPLLCQGVSRAVLLASSITERKSAASKTKDLSAYFLERGV